MSRSRLSELRIGMGAMVSETGFLDHESLQLAWNCAAGLVRTRPWLTISWVAHKGKDWHLVVHDGATGPALHFDDYPGPTLAGKSGVIALDWDDVIPLSHDIDWVLEWGPADIDAELTPKTAVYELLSALVALGLSWSVQPARFIGSESDPFSVFVLQELFPTIVPAVDAYVELIGGQLREGELAGRLEYWHEPLWLVARDGTAVAIIDESGQLHYPSSTSAGPSMLEVLRTLEDRSWEISQLTTAVVEGTAVRNDPEADSSESSISTNRQNLRVYVDFTSILTRSDWEIVRHARENDLGVSNQLLEKIGREFADAFGEHWWSVGFIGAFSWGVEWTFHIGDRGIGDMRADLLYLAASEPFIGYFYTGGRLLIDRLGSVECDIFVTSEEHPRVRGEVTEVVRVGTKGFEDWYAVARRIAERAR